eukprot:GILJ01010109.1.p1 GENE.GILJ01010109.1~~GILJ01010109.1.p1  ORF type:complete len:646 (+),score=69.01 GILJ01010109.1:131-2068(+)
METFFSKRKTRNSSSPDELRNSHLPRRQASSKKAVISNDIQHVAPTKARKRRNSEPPVVQPRPKRTIKAPERHDILLSQEERMLFQAIRNSEKLTSSVTNLENISDAPTYYPTEEEFQNPFRYLQKIQPEASRFGVCKIVPPASWSPPMCLDNSGFTFTTRTQRIDEVGQGKPFVFGDTQYNLKQYKQVADEFLQKWLTSHGMDPSTATPEMIEKEYWRIVETAPEPVEVLYGADVDTADSGSGFPQATMPGASKHRPALKNSPKYEHYLRHPWNLNSVPYAKESMLRFLGEEVSGVTRPWLYIGMLFSTFCWHNEDHHLYSINYLHEGAPKTWYGVPGEYATDFERMMRSSVMELFHERKGLLSELVTMLSPAVLKANKIPVCRMVQKAGEFAITFAQAYHGGFNQGFNIAEAVNIAPADWLPFGRAALDSYVSFKGQGRFPVFAHEKLVYHACERVNQLPLESQKLVYEELEAIRQIELKMYEDLKKQSMEVAANNALDPALALFLAQERHAIPWEIVPIKMMTTNDVTLNMDMTTSLGLTSRQRTGMANQGRMLKSEDDYQCSCCMRLCFFSALVCPEHNSIVCLAHATLLCNDKSKTGNVKCMCRKQLAFRFPLVHLGKVIDTAKAAYEREKINHSSRGVQ